MFNEGLDRSALHFSFSRSYEDRLFLPFLCCKVIESEGITTQSVKKKMQSVKAASTNPEFYSYSSFYFRRDDSDWNQTRFMDLGELEQSATVLSPSSMFSLKANNVGGVPDSLHYGTLNVGGCLDIGSTITGTGGRGCVDTGQQQPYMYQQQKGKTTSGNGQFENWDDNSAMADNSQQTDTYTDVDTDDKNHVSPSFSVVSVS